jgi:FkbM family methyltransferase
MNVEGWISVPWFRFLFLLRKVFLTRSSQRYWSQYGEDIVLDRVLNLKQPGFFVDVGCFHPVKYNNTFKLYRRGWRGVNLDLDPIKIDAFNLRRPDDVNLVAAVSDTERTVQVGSAGLYTVTATIDGEAIAKLRTQSGRIAFREVRTRTLTSLLDATRFRAKKIDVLSVDVEGHELPVLRSLDFERYQPKLLIVELHARTLEAVTESEVFAWLSARGYHLINWTGPSLIFLHPRERDQPGP